jgi:site-specific DNA recombinase
LVWEQVVGLLNTPELVRAEIERRIEESLSSDPVQQRKGQLEREAKRLGAQLDKLLDAYQEDLIGLAELRRRAPELRRRQAAVEKELEGVALQALEHSRLVQLNTSIENFLATLQRSAKTLEVAERQKIVRLLIKQIIVHADTLTIEHSIPVSRGPESPPGTSYLLCTRGNHRPLRGAPFGRLPAFSRVHYPGLKHPFQ